MNYRLGTLGLIAALVLSLPARAQDEESGGGEESAPAGFKAKLGDSLYFSPMFNYTKAANARGTKDGLGGQFAVGKSLTSGLNLELTAGYSQFDASGGAAKLTSVGLGAMVFPLTSLPDLYVPVVLQRGQFKDHPGPITDYGTTLFDIGLGYLLSLGDFGALRAEVKYRIDAHGREAAGTTPDQDKAFYEGVASLGLLIPLGSKAAPAEPAAEEAPVEIAPGNDADGDGVTDDLDQCPDTPAGTVVNAQGCEDAAPPPAEAPPPCPPPAAGEQVDMNGCKIGEAVVLRGVNFELDSAKLTPNAKTILDGVADSLLAAQGMSVEIGGHTSSEASDEYNLKLSDNRAEAVRQYLIARGVAGDRMTVKGYGETMPIADNGNEEGRELNRRVELKVTDGGAAAAPAEAAPAEAAPAAEEVPATDAAPVEGEAAPVEGETAAPAEGEVAPADAAPAEGEAAPAEGEAAPAEGEAAPADATAPAEGETAPEVQDAQPAQ